jgi:hypothetical protein
MKPFLTSLSCAFLFSAIAWCQPTMTSMSSGPGGMHGTMHFGPGSCCVATVAGAPFSGERIEEDVQTLADGTHIHRTIPRQKIYRDSMGRTRTERPAFQGIGRNSKAPAGPTIVEINDPIAHVRYIFDLDEPIAHRQQLPERNSHGFSGRDFPGHGVTPGTTAAMVPLGGADEPQVQPEVASTTTVRSVSGTAQRPKVDDEDHVKITTEKLGSEIIEGVQADGRRHTMTWPVGAIGNDAPITRISETWTSPELKEMILSKSDDPRSGEHTSKLIDINRSEPDASLFQPPPGYTVKVEKREFTLSWSAPRQ